jgi:hypothetical protein
MLLMPVDAVGGATRIERDDAEQGCRLALIPERTPRRSMRECIPGSRLRTAQRGLHTPLDEGVGVAGGATRQNRFRRPIERRQPSCVAAVRPNTSVGPGLFSQLRLSWHRRAPCVGPTSRTDLRWISQEHQAGFLGLCVPFAFASVACSMPVLDKAFTSRGTRALVPWTRRLCRGGCRQPMTSA